MRCFILGIYCFVLAVSLGGAMAMDEYVWPNRYIELGLPRLEDE